ncbi:DUF488 domain-containing protein [Nocardiopsis coralliicola]
MTAGPAIWTIGHWTLPIADFAALLHEHRIGLLADVRAHPGSRRSPQFGSEAMSRWLSENGIAYLRLPQLGGRRPRQDVAPGINAGWRNPSFRNYADYTLTEGYRSGIGELTAIAESRRVAIMCAEPVPWRCHRLLIANTLAARGWPVRHLFADGTEREHVLGQWGAPPAIDGQRQVTYPGQPEGEAPDDGR